MLNSETPWSCAFGGKSITRNKSGCVKIKEENITYLGGLSDTLAEATWGSVATLTMRGDDF